MAQYRSQLDTEVNQWKSLSFAESTKRTYKTHRDSYFRFCNMIKCDPIPISTDNLCRFAAFLGRSKAYTSVGQYINKISRRLEK